MTSSSCNGLEMREGLLTFLSNKGSRATFYTLIFNFGDLFKGRENGETSHISRGMGGVELKLFDNRPVTSQMIVSKAERCL